MNQIPPSWTIAPINNLVLDPNQDIVDGPFGSNLKATEYQSSGIPIIRLQNIDRNQFINKNIKYISQAKAEQLVRHKFVTGDVVVTKLGDPLGEAAIVPSVLKEGIIVADIVRIRVAAQLIDPKFLAYAINSPSIIDGLKKHIKGTTRPRINLNIVRNLEVPVAPYNEQKLVSKILDEIFKLTRNVSSIIRSVENSLDQIQSSFFTQIFTDLGSKAEFQSLDTLTDKIGSGSTPKGGQSSYSKSGVPLIRSMNVHMLSFNITGMAYLNEDQAEKLESVKVKKNDVLLNITGASIGRVTVVPSEFKNARVNQHVCIIRPNLNKLLPEFLAYYLSSSIVQHQIHVENYGVTRQALTKGMISNFQIPVPDIEVQKKLIEIAKNFLSMVGELRETIARVERQMNEVESSSVSLAFKGELTQNWRKNQLNLSSENANSLLVQIQQMRATQPAKLKRAKRNVVKGELNMNQKNIISVLDVLKSSREEKSAQELLTLAGYPIDATTADVEKFFLDVREHLKKGTIKKVRRGEQDYFSITKRK